MSPSIETQTLNATAQVPQTKSLNGNTNGTTNGTDPSKIATDVNDLKDRLLVEHSQKAFGSRAISLIDLPPTTPFLKITLATPSKKAYTSVQTGPTTHIELNSDIVYVNHSCKPSLVFDMQKMEVRVVEGRHLKRGDALTFFYPSSEWDMAQPFECTCGEECCRGVIDGAGKMDEGVLRGYWLNKHIEQLLDERNGGEGASAKEDGN